MGVVPPTRWNSPSWRTRSRRICGAGRAARQSRRGTACRRPRPRKRPRAAAIAPVKAPFSWPNSSLSSSVSGEGAAVDRHEPLGPPRAVIVDGAGDEFLASPGFPQDERGDVGRGQGAHHAVEFLHLGALADDAGETVLPLDFLVQANVLQGQRALLDVVLDEAHIRLAGLPQVLEEEPERVRGGLFRPRCLLVASRFRPIGGGSGSTGR